MAYVNVSEWKAEQVAEWLQGLDDSIYPYAHSFLNNNVTGRGLLNVTVDDLYKLQVEKVGHQEIILEALDDLRNLHHNLDTENLQYVCLKLSCKARSLANEIWMYGPDPEEVKQSVDTSVMSAVADVTDALWTLITWLHRPPFNQNSTLNKEALVRIGVELTTTAWRDTFAEEPVNKIRDCCTSLADLADHLISEVDDPLILQPASLDIATVKRRPNDETLDFGIALEQMPLGGVYVIHKVRFQSPAHQCARIHPGDEVVQVNYQTVVGWTLKKILQLMAENPSELILTLKKRPRHLPVFGQIYMKPFRIPARTHSNKKVPAFNNLPSPRAELLVAPNIRRFAADASAAAAASASPKEEAEAGRPPIGVASSEDEDDDDPAEDAFLPTAVASASSPNKSPTQSVRSLLSRPRSTPLRRATISGSSPSLSRPYINVSEVWSCHARNIHSFDQSAKSCSSNSSTLRSNDSGTATMSTSPGVPELRHKYLPRPSTVGCYSSNGGPAYINMEPLPTITTADWSSGDPLDPPKNVPPSQQSAQFITAREKAPKPKPRTQLQPATNPSPSRKKPIPQPRSVLNTYRTLKTLLPLSSSSSSSSSSVEKLMQPVPTSEFQSFRRVVAAEAPTTTRSDALRQQEAPPEYVNTTPPEVPARNTVRRPSQILQQAKKPSSRRFSGDFQHGHDGDEDAAGGGAAAPPPLPGNKPKRPTPLLGNIPRRSSMDSSNSLSSMGSSTNVPPPPQGNAAAASSGQRQETQQSIPYYMSDVTNRGRALPDQSLPPEKPPRASSNNPSLPPAFSPSSYSVRELQQRSCSGKQAAEPPE